MPLVTFTKIKEFALQSNPRYTDADPWSVPTFEPLKTTAEIGLRSLPTQQTRKTLNESILFNMMVVGKSGLGKTTFLNSLFDIECFQYDPNPTQDIHETELEEFDNGSSNVKLTVIDTPGFGATLNAELDLTPITNYIQQKNSHFFSLEKQSQLFQKSNDQRVHLVLYFLSPNNSNLTQLDIKALSTLAEYANVLPLVGKSDTLTQLERLRLQKNILDEIKTRRIPIFHIEDAPDCCNFFDTLPFCVMGSNQTENVSGTKKKCRKYPWGIVDISNPKYSDFSAFRNFVLDSHFLDLMKTTSDTFYNNYRKRSMMNSTTEENEGQQKPDNLREVFHLELLKAETKMKAEFIKRVKEKDIEIASIEEEFLIKRDKMLAPLMNEQASLQEEMEEVDYLLSSTSGNGKKGKAKAAK